jgi:hypothetical protein
MKDLKYLLLLIGFVIIAHVTKKPSERNNQAKLLPDLPDYREQKESDSGRIEASNRPVMNPAIFGFYNKVN